MAGLVGLTCANAQTLALTNARLLDVEKGTWLENRTVVVEGDKIRQVFSGKKGKIPADARVLDLTGKWVVPGLVDAHIHLFQSGGLYTRPDGFDLRKYRPYEVERQWLKDHFADQLRRYVAYGITTVIDPGGPLYQLPLRDSLAARPDLPRLLLAGPLVSTWQPPNLPTDSLNAPILAVKTPEEARHLVRRQLPAKPDFVKIWYIVMPGKKAKDTLPIVQAAIDESHVHGLKVAVHAMELTTARLAVEAGADYLVHMVEDLTVDEEFVALLKQRKTVVCPTLTVFSGQVETLRAEPYLSRDDFAKADPFVVGSLFDLRHLPDQKLATQMRQMGQYVQKRVARSDSVSKINLRALLAAGVSVATGTDAGNPGILHATSYHRELSAMQAAGLSNADILRASTLNGAKALGKEAEVGSIAAGKLANLLVLNANPLDSLAHLRRIDVVINRGVLVRPDTLLRDTPETLAQRQLNAYNARDIEAFLEPYADDVEIYEMPSQKLLAKGKQQMRKMYAGMFERVKNLHCELRNRIVQGNVVVDHERVTGFGPKPVEAIATYFIEKGKIAKVYFPR